MIQRFYIISLCLSLLACQGRQEQAPIIAEPTNEESQSKETDEPIRSNQLPPTKEQSKIITSPEKPKAQKQKPQPSQVKEKKEIKKMAIIKFDSTLHRLDTMQEGDIKDVVFRFWNTGNAPLTIDEVDVTCGCTTPSIPFLDILPGDTSTIDIQYKSVGKSGLQEPEIIVKTNGAPTYTKLKLEVFVAEKEKR